MKSLWWVLATATVTTLGACSFPTENYTLGALNNDSGASDSGTAVDVQVPSDDGLTDVLMPKDDGATDDRGMTDSGGGDVASAGCAMGQTSCSGSCVDTRTSEDHCGACGQRCDDMNYCRNGTCTAVVGHYIAVRPTSNFIDACTLPGATTILRGQDDAGVMVPLPFDVNYWGITYPTSSPMVVSSNGWMSFDRDAISVGTLYSAELPSRARPNALLAPLLIDLVTPSGVCVAQRGTAPSRTLIVQWNNARYFADSSAMGPEVTFEVLIREGSGHVEFLYQSVPAYPTVPSGGMRTLTVGLESESGALGLARCSGVMPGDCMGIGSNARLSFDYDPTP